MKEEKFAEMEYTPNRKRTLLAQGTYNGLNYYVLSLGTHPCAYVECDKNHIVDDDHIYDIDCHGGITYNEKILILPDKRLESIQFIGWDYAHCDDYAGYEVNFPEDIRVGGYKWTTDEIITECRNVIDQVVNFNLQEGN